jgi:hypothetical protein
MSIQKRRPTMRASDLGYAPRYFGFFRGFELSRFEGESTLPPQAGNANRWAAESDKETGLSVGILFFC